MLRSKSLDDGPMLYQVEIWERPAQLIVLLCMEDRHMYSNNNLLTLKKSHFQKHSPFPHLGLHCVLSHHLVTVLLTPCRAQKLLWRTNTCSWIYLITGYPKKKSAIHFYRLHSSYIVMRSNLPSWQKQYYITSSLVSFLRGLSAHKPSIRGHRGSISLDSQDFWKD